MDIHSLSRLTYGRAPTKRRNPVESGVFSPILKQERDTENFFYLGYIQNICNYELNVIVIKYDVLLLRSMHQFLI